MLKHLLDIPPAAPYCCAPCEPTGGTLTKRPGREGMVIDTVIQIKLKKGEAVERALRRLKKIMDKEGMMKQLRANRYYEKPSEKKRRKSARARSRILSGR